MKGLKKFAALALCAVIGVSSANAQTDAEEIARKQLAQYLNSQGIATQVDKKDQSLNFVYKDESKKEVLYWVTFKGNARCMLFTLHRRPIKVLNDKQAADKELSNRILENAARAAELVTASNTYKAFLKGSQVEFQFPVFAANTDDYKLVFDNILKSMKNVKSSFDACYKRARVYNDSVHNYWMTNDTSKYIVKQHALPGAAQSGNNLKISGVKVHNVDAAGNEISGFNENPRRLKARYIEPQVTVTSAKKGTFKIGLKIITPQGKTLVPSKDARYTTVTTVEIAKVNKPQEVLLAKFGVDNDSLWDTGDYILEFYEDDRKIDTDSFTVL